MRIPLPRISADLRTVLRNVGFGLGAQGWSALLGLAAMPLLVTRLGAEAYGLVGLNLSVIMLAATGDLGVGRAVGKFLAEDPRDREANDRYVAVGLALSLGFGLAGAALLAAAAPLVVERVFGVGEDGAVAARNAFYVTAATLPAVLLRILLTGVLVSRAALGRLSIAAVTADTLKTALAVAAAWSGAPLAWVVAAYGAAAYVHVGLLSAAAFGGRKPLARLGVGFDRPTARRLLGFGGWGTAATLAQQALVELDRWLVGALVSLEALGYYSVARDVCLRQGYIPQNVLRAYFASFSSAARRASNAFGRTYRQAQRLLALLSLSLGWTLALFGGALLAAWFGAATAVRAEPAMAALALGYAAGAVGQGAAMAVSIGAAQPAALARMTAVALALYAPAGAAAASVGGAPALAACFLLTQLGWSVAVERWVCRRVPGAPPAAALLGERALVAAVAGGTAALGAAALTPHAAGLPAVLAALGATFVAAIAASASALAAARRFRNSRASAGTWRPRLGEDRYARSIPKAP